MRLGSAASGSTRAQVRLVHEALDAGVRVFDTADAYGAGNSERILGRALAGRRSEAIVATKAGYRFTERSPAAQQARRVARRLLRGLSDRAPATGASTSLSGGYRAKDFSPTHLREAVDGSLRRLRTDYIDVFQLHGPDTDADPAVVELAGELIASGKVRRFGIGAERLGEAVAWMGARNVSTVQVPFGMLDPEAAASVLPAATAAGVEVWARGVLGGGLLSLTGERRDELEHDVKWPLIARLLEVADGAGVSIFQLALDYVRCRPEVAVILVGTSSGEHLRKNIAMLSRPAPSADVIEAVDRVVGAWTETHGGQ